MVKTVKKVAIVGLGWLGMPLARALIEQGYTVTGSKTRLLATEAACLHGVACYQINFAPKFVGDVADLNALLAVDTLIITLPAGRTIERADWYRQAVHNLVDCARARGVSRVVFCSSISVYGAGGGILDETSPCVPTTVAGRTLVELEKRLCELPGVTVDILRLAGLVGPKRHPGRFLAGKQALAQGNHPINLVHLEDVIGAITALLTLPGGNIFNLCAPTHPLKRHFYPLMSRQLGLVAPQFGPDLQHTDGKVVRGEHICRLTPFRYRWTDFSQMPAEREINA